MANQKNTAATPLLRDLFRLEVYKRSQGRITRQVTFLALAVGVVLLVWSSNNLLSDVLHWFGNDFLAWLGSDSRIPDSRLIAVRYALNGLFVMAGVWISYRAVNYHKFADFLIAVEAEMNKVSWPSRLELMRSSIVVLVTIFTLAFLLFGYDFFWSWLLQSLGITG